MQINNAAHGQSRQVGDEVALGTGDGHWKRADDGRLIDDEQESTVSLEFGEEGAQLGLVAGRRLVVHALVVPIECNGVMLAFTDVDADEDFDGIMLSFVLHRSFCRESGLACNNGGKPRHPRYGRRRDTSAKPLSAITSHPPDPLDHDYDWRGGNHAEPGWPKPQLSGREDSNGAKIVVADSVVC
ncbi:hypothetical protein BDI4_540009 [Burkholderia diffusa]|nr:hypothetical protein BDI4_540009 [Burkholderia diffusa]